MGGSEGYKFDLFDWLDTLSVDDRKTYDDMFPKPVFWHDNIGSNYYELIALWPYDAKYTLEHLISTGDSNKQEFLFFWKPDVGQINESCLGQWQPSQFFVDLDKYHCAEQYMMAEKAKLFNDENIEEKILHSSDAREIKALGKKVRGFKQAVWDKVKFSIVLNRNYYKFTQNKPMFDFLLATGDKILVEAGPLDRIWGIGLSSNDYAAHNAATWKGQNLLGFALMQ